MLEKLLGSVPEKMVQDMLKKSVGELLAKTGAKMLVITMENEAVKFTPITDMELVKTDTLTELKRAAKAHYLSI